MPVARSGVLWRRIFFALLAVTVAVYVWRARVEYTHGGSPLGLAFGIAGYLLILLLAFFGIRKRWYRSRLGTLEGWLQSHIWLGLLVLVILALHTGGRFHDKVAVFTFILTAIVVVSGIAGAILYVTVPRVLTEVESELTAEEISDQINQLGRSLARVASEKSLAFQKIYDSLAREARPGAFAGWRLLVAPMRRKSSRSAELSDLIALVPKSEEEDLRQALVISRQRKELLIRLRYQQKYRNVLQAWLYIHVPFTIALLVFAAVHVAAVFYYGQIR